VPRRVLMVREYINERPMVALTGVATVYSKPLAGTLPSVGVEVLKSSMSIHISSSASVAFLPFTNGMSSASDIGIEESEQDGRNEMMLIWYSPV